MDTTITTKGQVVIPVRFRKKFDLKPGTTVRFEEIEGQLVLVPTGKALLKKLRGSLSGELLEDLATLRKNEHETGRF